MSDLQQLWAQTRHIYSRLDFLEEAVTEALSEASPRAAASLKAKLEGIYKTPEAALRAADARDRGPVDESPAIAAVKAGMVREVGADPGWERTPWANPENH